MTNLIDSLTIRGFRSLSELQIPTLSKVNLITGKNNAGKSSLLEAIRIFITKGSTDTLRSILSYREELTPTSGTRAGGYDSMIEQEDFNLIRSLFLNYPDILSQTQRVELSISATGSFSSRFNHLSIKPTWMIKRRSDDELELTRYTEAPDEDFGEGDGRPALSLQIGEQRRQIPLTSMLRPRPTGSFLTKSNLFGDGMTEAPNLYLDPFSAKSTGKLGMLWDAIALTDAQDTVLKALQLISPDIQAVSMIGGDGRVSSGRTTIVRSTRFDSPIPLRSYGDGMNRLFGIILSMCNVRNGILLIDEFENGLHYSVQPLIWKTIFQLARDLNVQVFATTHSRDCVLAFQEAAADSPEDGQLIRLTRKGAHVLSTSFTEEELKTVVDNDIEVR